MPSPSKSALPKAAQPKYGRNFDPWNSVALGHQRAETKGPQGWRENRTWKLQHQLAAGNSGGARLSDAVGAGSEDYDEEHQVLIPKEVRARATNNVLDMLRKPGTMAQGRSRSASPDKTYGDLKNDVISSKVEKHGTVLQREENDDCESPKGEAQGSDSKMFDGLVVYVNGSTHPLISDHKLKHVLVENGASMSIHLGRRKVTHVILGRPSGPSGGAGGGLAGGKLDKEIRRVGGCGIKYVGVEWVLESLKAGRRLPEAKFSNLKVASKGQPSVYGAFKSTA
ncbi:hypothetical protein N0V93_000474 [Gnomoniopsis smithogilvyi]|uniref:BRCT domain-containing protein n=1 Tax=Gnomoniopsis smithogilvyi TaxID=1191159 RepID=A0A9W8Z1Z2_9PEZI|nr:hypothetical protein N0V93_000474 [Gnomoniopsis smithogilvyi]